MRRLAMADRRVSAPSCAALLVFLVALGERAFGVHPQAHAQPAVTPELSPPGMTQPMTQPVTQPATQPALIGSYHGRMLVADGFAFGLLVLAFNQGERGFDTTFPISIGCPVSSTALDMADSLIGIGSSGRRTPRSMTYGKSMVPFATS